jgi:murein DD-endopeptidase MepM/ murein hydrolase activator NlpD
MRTTTAFILGFAFGVLALTAVLWSTGHLALLPAQAAHMEPAPPVTPTTSATPEPAPGPTLPPAPEPAPTRVPTDLPAAAQPLAVQPPAPGAAPTLAMPIAGVDPSTLHSNFNDARGGHKHEALDIMSPRGTPVLAVAEGNVAKLFNSKQGGLTVYQFDDTQKWCYYYAHLDHYAAGLKEGTLLRKGEVLGYVGSTGDASPEAPHLHFSVFVLGPEKHWWQGTAVDPLPMLKQLVPTETRP